VTDGQTTSHIIYGAALIMHTVQLMYMHCAGNKDAPDCRGVVRTLLAASTTLQFARHLVSRNQLVSFVI